MKSLLQENNLVTQSAQNEGKSVPSERFIKTLKNKISKYLASISKNVYIDKLAEKVNEYNNMYHTTMKTKSVNVTSSTHINYNAKNNDKDPKFFEVNDHVKR